MAGAGVIPLVTDPTIANIKLHHVLIDGDAGLNVNSFAAFKQLQILESKLDPSRQFFGVGPHSVYPVGTISLPVMFGMEENFRTENIQFDVAEVNLPFSAIIGRPALYRFMAVAYYSIWSAKCRPLQESSPCRATGPLLQRQLRSCMHWQQASPRLPASRGPSPHPHALGHQPGCPNFVRLIQTMSP
ncbi:hypothetical protein GQ55_2G219100 [Panicum hallii var. hallii]|uniref:Uncharacterized protein n=1 Tax=Panicum hallii var. hallii TaxID=1504633 RepID=A0A2T7ER65_9POAL|nr:hypothetical protein GQ55_2G219100 [Panicum hallii var. hallii]